MKKAITIEGMSCENCLRHVTKALYGLDGVKNVEVNLSTGRALIEMDKEVLDSDIKSSIDEAGYVVTNIEMA